MNLFVLMVIVRIDYGLFLIGFKVILLKCWIKYGIFKNDIEVFMFFINGMYGEISVLIMCYCMVYVCFIFVGRVCICMWNVIKIIYYIFYIFGEIILEVVVFVL